MLQQRLEVFIKERNFKKAIELKNEITELSISTDTLSHNIQSTEQDKDIKHIDINTLRKCLKILIVHLSSSKIVSFSPTLRTVKKEILDQLLSHENEEIIALVMKCNGLFALLDKSVAEETIHLLCLPVILRTFFCNIYYVLSFRLLCTRMA